MIKHLYLIRIFAGIGLFFGFISNSFGGLGLGTQIEDWWDTKTPDKNKKAYNVKKLNRTFLMVSKADENSPWRQEAFFLDGECVQMRLILNSENKGWESLGDEALKLIWGVNFRDEKIEDIQREDTFVAYWGENGGLMSYGKSEKNKGVLNLENAKMRFVSDKYIRSLLKNETSNTASKKEDGLKMTGVKVGGRMKPIFSTDGGLKGYMSDRGLFFNQNMEYEGWMNNR